MRTIQPHFDETTDKIVSIRRGFQTSAMLPNSNAAEGCAVASV